MYAKWETSSDIKGGHADELLIYSSFCCQLLLHWLGVHPCQHGTWFKKWHKDPKLWQTKGCETTEHRRPWLFYRNKSACHQPISWWRLICCFVLSWQEVKAWNKQHQEPILRLWVLEDLSFKSLGLTGKDLCASISHPGWPWEWFTAAKISSDLCGPTHAFFIIFQL